MEIHPTFVIIVNYKYFLSFQGRIPWREARIFAGVCFACCLSYKPPNLKSAWFAHLQDEDRHLPQHLHDIACFRVVQATRMIQYLSSGSGFDAWKQTLMQKHCTSQVCVTSNVEICFR